MAILFGEPLRPAFAQAAAPNRIDRTELVAAIENGQAITGRTISAQILTEIISQYVRTAPQCDTSRRVMILDSIIDGSIALSVPQFDDDALSTNKAPPARYLSIPLTINRSTLLGRLSFEGLNVACPTDLSNSTFAEQVTFRIVEFLQDFKAKKSTFAEGFTATGVLWHRSASFQRASFKGNADFLRSYDPRAKKRTTFLGETDFEQAVFGRYASFLDVVFTGAATFKQAQFLMDASFSQSQIGPVLAGRGRGPFYMAEFSGRALFRGVRFNSLTFWRTVFRGAADYSRSRGKTLAFNSAIWLGRIDFDDARVSNLLIISYSGLVTVEGDVMMRRLRAERLDIQRVIFRKTFNLEGAQVGCSLSMRTVSFDSQVRLEDATFPAAGDTNCQTMSSRQGISLRGITFEGPVFVDQEDWLRGPDWWNFAGENDSNFDVSKDEQRRFWRELERAFRKAENLELKNDAYYRGRYLDEQQASGVKRLFEAASRVYWGYGLRPIRVFLWGLIVVICFAGIYWTQFPRAESPTQALRSGRQSLAFSFRTAWEFRFGYEHSRGAIFTSITILESVLGKVIVACFIYSLTQASPLLSELAKKILP